MEPIPEPDFSKLFLDRYGKDAADHEAWLALSDTVWTYVRPLVSFGFQEADLEDIVQEVLLRIVRALPAFDRQREGSLRCWLRTITQNWSKTEAGRVGRKKLADMLPEDLPSAEDDPAVIVEKVEASTIFAEIRRRVAEESPVNWRAFTLSLEPTSTGKPRTAKDVAEMLGMSVTAVWQANSRVKSRFRELCVLAIDREMLGHLDASVLEL